MGHCWITGSAARLSSILMGQSNEGNITKWLPWYTMFCSIMLPRKIENIDDYAAGKVS